MAKGTLHLNVEFSAVADEEGKFGRLAKLLGLADADHARGRCEHLWVACTRRGESELPQWLVEQVLGEIGPDALVQAELAAWAGGRGDSSTRRLRIGGAAKHCLWMSRPRPNAEQSSKGGKTRSSTSSRSAGRFISDHQPITSPSEISSEITLPEKEISPSARAILPTPVHGGEPGTRQPGPRATQQGAAMPGQSAGSAAGDVAEPQTSPTPDRTGPPPSTGTFSPDDPRARGRLAEATYRRVSDALVAIAGELKLPAPLPFPAVTPGSHPQSLRELQDRVREEGASAPLVCDRVVANLVAQAREERSVEWLAEKAFSAKPWAAARAWMPGAAARRRGPAKGDPLPPAPAPKRDPAPSPVVVSASEREEARQMAAELRDRLSNAARAPPKSALEIRPTPRPATPHESSDMTDPRILRLRVELYTAAQQLKGDDLLEFTHLIREIAMVLRLELTDAEIARITR